MEKITLNENQKEAVVHDTGPVLVIAGAGTGKTRVITERIKHLIQKKEVDPQHILALTFTDKASEEMLLRTGDIMPLGYEEPWVYTFHAFCDRILQTEGLEIGLDIGYKILSGPEQWLLLRKHLFKMDLNYFRPLGNPTKFISAILKFISRLQDENIDEEEFNKYVLSLEIEKEEKERWKELSYIYTQYNKLKIENSRLDFGDLITWTIKLFKDRPNILQKYQEKFKHVLVDEFQDTNYAQYELIKLLCPSELKDRSLITVGDDSQSIYKFRGAAVSNILQFKEDYPKAKTITLLKNYRSIQNILDPAYNLIKNNNPDTLESKLGISKELVSQLPKAENEPSIAQMETLEDEVEFVISKIYEILAKEPQYTYKDFAILARAKNHLDPFLLALRKHGLPYQLVGNRGLYDREEIRDIISLLRTIINPKDSISLYRVLNIDTLEIDQEQITRLLSQSRYKKVDLWELINDIDNDNINKLYKTILKYQDMITKTTPTQFVYDLVNEIKYVQQFLEPESIENQLSINNLDLFLKKIQKFEVDYHEETKNIPTIIDFVDHLDLIIEAGENPAQAEIQDIDTINLMTVHASKGLEFPVIFMINLVGGRFPTRNRSDMIEVPDELIKEELPSGNSHIQEERRLFYVGMTRAQKYLFLTLGKNYGGKREKKPSGYLEETNIPMRSIDDITAIKSPQNTLFGAETDYRNLRLQKITDFEPKFISYSQINNYETCPLRYKYSYILHIPTAPAHPLSFGITIHETLKEFHTRKMFDENVKEENLLNIYEKNWQPLGYANETHRQQVFQHGKELLKTYYEKHKDEKVKHAGIEKKFKLNLNGVTLGGVIDRIDKLPNGKYEIVDYKTGTPKDQKTVDKDDQISIYALAAEKGLNLDLEKLSLYFLETQEKVTTTRNEDDLEKIQNKILSIVKRMKEGKFEATPGMHCSWCDYKNICPFAYKN